jgi:adenylate kinase
LNKQKKIVIFVGPPGSGKGSLSNLCIEHLSWVQLSTGNLCRKHIAEQTEIGKHIEQAIAAGKLISDQMIVAMVNEWLVEQVDGLGHIILDGYPRTVAQAQALKDFITEKLPQVDLTVVRLFISDEQVASRLSGRAICQNKDCQMTYSILAGSSLAPKQAMICNKCSHALMRRNDDDMEAIRERLKTYYRHEQDLLSYYEKSGITIKGVKVEMPLHDVFDQFKQLMGV